MADLTQTTFVSFKIPKTKGIGMKQTSYRNVIVKTEFGQLILMVCPLHASDISCI